MSKNPKDINRKDAPDGTFGLTVPGPLYSTFGPLPVPEVEESNTDSVWALFETVPTKASLLMPLTAPTQDTRGDEPEDPFAPTEMSPLRP